MFFKRLAAVAIMSAFVASGASAAQTLCNLDDTGGGQGSSTLVFSPVLFLFNDAESAVQVIDPLILQVNEEALQGRVRKIQSGMRVSWTVSGVPFMGGSSGRIRYTANLSADKKAIAIRGRITNAENYIAGKGTCRKLNDAELRQILRDQR